MSARRRHRGLILICSGARPRGSPNGWPSSARPPLNASPAGTPCQSTSFARSSVPDRELRGAYDGGQLTGAHDGLGAATRPASSPRFRDERMRVMGNRLGYNRTVTRNGTPLAGLSPGDVHRHYDLDVPQPMRCATSLATQGGLWAEAAQLSCRSHGLQRV